MVNLDLFKKPLVTEKALSRGEYAFAVKKEATKREIKEAIKMLFGVKVIAINTMVVKGKKRRAWGRRAEAQLGDWKKAVVRLPPDQKIDLFETGGKPREGEK